MQFLNRDQVVALHERQIVVFGGLSGVRDEGMLLSALEQPKMGLGEDYLHKDLYEMAAAYLFHLVKNHAFFDGNKRIAVLSCVVFLEANGLRIIATENELEKLVHDAAISLISKEQIAEFIRKNSSRKD